MLLSLTMGLVGWWGLLFGRVGWARLAGRRQAGLALGASVVAFFIGGITIGASADAVATPASKPAPTVTVTVTATVTATPTPTPTEDPQPEPAPSSTIQRFAPAAASTTKAAPPATTVAPKSASGKTTQATKAAAAANTSVYYKNCAAVRSAGKDPIYRGQPGYASHLDRDNDGIACE